MPWQNIFPLVVQATVSGIIAVRTYAIVGRSTASISHGRQAEPAVLLTCLQWNRNKAILALLLTMQAGQSAFGGWFVATYVKREYSRVFMAFTRASLTVSLHAAIEFPGGTGPCINYVSRPTMLVGCVGL